MLVFVKWWTNNFLIKHVTDISWVILNPKHSFKVNGWTWGLCVIAYGQTAPVCHSAQQLFPSVLHSEDIISAASYWPNTPECTLFRNQNRLCWCHGISMLWSLTEWRLKPGGALGATCPQTEAIPASLMFLSVGFMGFSYPHITLFERGHASGFNAPLFLHTVARVRWLSQSDNVSVLLLATGDWVWVLLLNCSLEMLFESNIPAYFGRMNNICGLYNHPHPSVMWKWLKPSRCRSEGLTNLWYFSVEVGRLF